uniref:Uncharacterized protein LOC111110081 n=1 Tax=Crassostrea virginica TaxID=6565 RepID=A0A8B8BFV8_CRAVI|nr:uncharacterized protein LOC111110081 [Crassostrea virginica]
MDPDYSAQDVARCDLCKTAIAQSYCDFCHVNLCKPCIGEHISDDYKKHIIVPILQRKSTLIYPKCETHVNKSCKYQCQDCDIFVCSDCAMSKQHKGHEYLKLEELFIASKQRIGKDKEELDRISPTYEEIVIELENQITNLDGEYEKLTTEMSKQREELHREIDNAINQMEKEIGEIKVKHHSILKEHLDEIKQVQSLMQKTLVSLNEIEESNEVSPTIHYSSKVEDFRKLPPKVNVSMPKLIPKQVAREELSSLIGKLIPLSTTLEERVFTAKKPNTSVRELLDEPEVLNTIKTGLGYLHNVTCLNEEQIWTSGNTADIKCFNIQGVLQKTIQTMSRERPSDIAFDIDWALLYSDRKTGRVYKVKDAQTEEIIRLQGWTPRQLCVTSSGELLVIMRSEDATQSKVVRYSGSTIKQTIQFDNGHPLYSGNDTIKYITENRNLDICVADPGAGAVVVVNQAGKLRYRYTGHPSPTKNKPFSPRGITTDSQSHILTADADNNCIHILNADGQFLRYIDNCDLTYPYGVCVDSNDSLFVFNTKMDPDYIPQDVARCGLCKTAIAQSYCDFCHVNLCKPCIGEHISDDYKKHIIVPILQRKSTLIYPKCETHVNKSCKYQCQDCNIFVCSDCTVSTQHKGHEYLRLEEMFTKSKECIGKDKEEFENISPTYEEIVIELENQITNLDEEYEKLTTEMSKQREELHREVDNAINQMEKEISEIKMKHHSILKKHLNEIKQVQSLMQKTLVSLNEIEESNEVSPTIHYSSKVEEFRKLPPKVNVSMPKFIPKQIEREELCSLIGKLTPLSTALEERVFTAKKPNTSVRELLDESEVLNTIKTGHEQLRSVTCLNEEQIWTSGKTADIKCFNIQGVLQKTIQTKSGEYPNDIAVDIDGALLCSDWKTGRVYKVKDDQTEEIIRLQGWRPRQMCVTSSGELLVIMRSEDETQSKVVRYSGSTVKQTIQFDIGQPLYSGNKKFKYITQNRNLDICVADLGAGAVVVVNQVGKLRFRYTGHPSPTKNKPFKPRGITTDSQSHILTADADNNCIHILHSDGQFLRYIDNCDLKDPCGLCVDSNDSLFVCELVRGSVKKIKYLK